jgi:uncharacterized protein YycO
MFKILACHGTSFESQAIEFLTGPRSHIRIQVLRDYTGIDAFGKPVVLKAGNCVEAWNSGVRKIESWDVDYAKGTVIESFSLRDELPEPKGLMGLRFLCRQIGKPYDWAGVERLALPPGARKVPSCDGLAYWNYDAWFCSALAGGLCDVAGIPCFNAVKAYDMTPQALPESLRFNSNPERLVVT